MTFKLSSKPLKSGPFAPKPLKSIKSIKPNLVVKSTNRKKILKRQRSRSLQRLPSDTQNSREFSPFFDSPKEAPIMGDINEIKFKTDLMSLGKICEFEGCRTQDYLPFKCNYCNLTFCKHHFSILKHNCKSFIDRKVIPCPICGMVLPFNDSRIDPNIIVNSHISRGKCRKVKKTTFKCSICNQTELVSVRCNYCGQQLCFEHLDPSSHSCIL